MASRDSDRATAVCEMVLNLIRNPAAAGSVAIPADLAPLIEPISRYAYMIATKMPDDMIDHEQSEELETLVKEDREPLGLFLPAGLAPAALTPFTSNRSARKSSTNLRRLIDSPRIPEGRHPFCPSVLAD